MFLVQSNHQYHQKKSLAANSQEIVVEEKSAHHVVSKLTGRHVNHRTAHVLLDLDILYESTIQYPVSKTIHKEL
jgi:hypothetical protein